MQYVESMLPNFYSAEDIAELGASSINDPDLFKRFADGLNIDENFLKDPEWNMHPVGDQDSMIWLILLHMLPAVYSTSHLAELGGHITISVGNEINCTLLEVNGRVVAFSGIYQENSVQTAADLKISPDAFLSFARYSLMSSLNPSTFKCDEKDDFVLGDSHLLLAGMPTGGWRQIWSDAALEASDVTQMEILSETSFMSRGMIEHYNDYDAIGFYGLAGVEYTFQVFGEYSRGGTLVDPLIEGIYDSTGWKVNEGNDDFDGDSKEPKVIFTPEEDGVYYVNVGSFTMTIDDVENAVGSYTFYASTDKPHGIGAGTDDDDSTTVKDAISSEDEIDLVPVELVSGVTYSIKIAADTDGSQAGLAEPEIVRITNASGEEVHLGSDGTDGDLLFRPETNGGYVIEVAGNGGTGAYELTIDVADDQYSGSELPPGQIAEKSFQPAPSNGADGVDGIGATADFIDTTSTTETSDTFDVLDTIDMTNQAVTPTAATRGHGEVNHFWCESNRAIGDVVPACGFDQSACAFNTGAAFACAANVHFGAASASGLFGCGANASLGGLTVTGAFVAAADAWVCGVAATGAFVGGASAHACGFNTSTAYACLANASACGAAFSLAPGLCEINTSAVGFSASATVYHCSVATQAKGVNATAGVEACGVDKVAAGVNASLIDACGVDTNACAVNVQGVCSVDTTACAVNLAWGADAGACIINVFPILPSC
ncbi:hypothetical protein JCM19238_4103 [Vibrio ponticus]|nr:hypothetical protein JCM19238_4103 [Vibrio ponticus]